MKKCNGRAESRSGGIPQQSATTVGLAVRPYLKAMQRAILVWSLAIIAGAAIVAQAAIFTCPKCSYEQPENATQCSHSGAALPKLPPVPVAPQPVALGPTVWTTMADDNWRKASEVTEQSKLWLGWFYARNAYALNRMVEETNSTRNVRLVGLVKTLEKHLRPATQPCPLCVGNGKMPRYVKMSDGRQQMIPNAQTCPRCNGARTLPAINRADVLAHNRDQVKRDYDALQQDRGWMSVEDVWLPPNLATNLALKERAQLLHILGSPCLNCAGMGIHACIKCDGAGWIKCSKTECISGTTPCTDCDGTGKAVPGKPSAKHGGYCRTCSSLGRITCKTCKGNASLICPTCAGRDEQVCKICGGSGQNALCSTCKGEGLRMCTTCKGNGYRKCTTCSGSGKQKNITCANCKGVGQIECTDCKKVGQLLCTNCKGVGRVAKR
jgi:hypothetical protein